MIRLAAKVRRGTTIVMGVAGALDDGRAAAGFIAHPRHGLALYCRGRTGDDFRCAVAGDGTAMEVAFAGYGFHESTAAMRHSPAAVR